MLTVVRCEAVAGRFLNRAVPMSGELGSAREAPELGLGQRARRSGRPLRRWASGGQRRVEGGGNGVEEGLVGGRQVRACAAGASLGPDGQVIAAIAANSLRVAQRGEAVLFY